MCKCIELRAQLQEALSEIERLRGTRCTATAQRHGLTRVERRCSFKACVWPPMCGMHRKVYEREGHINVSYA